MSDLNNVYQETEKKMQKNLDSLSKNLVKIRTDRAHPSMLENINVDYYNQHTQIARIANIVVEDHRTLSITPFDKSAVNIIEKAIAAANIGLNPVVVSNTIKIPIPQLTEERRKILVKQTKADVEIAKVAVRNVRRDANLHIKSLVNSKQISLNDKEIAESKVQKLTDQYIDKIDKIGYNKEQELMKI